MNPFSHTGLSISDSLKSVRKSVLIYETIIPHRNGQVVKHKKVIPKFPDLRFRATRIFRSEIKLEQICFYHTGLLQFCIGTG